MKRKISPEEAKRRAMMMELVRELGITDVNELYITMRDMFAGTLGQYRTKPTRADGCIPAISHMQISRRSDATLSKSASTI